MCARLFHPGSAKTLWCSGVRLKFYKYTAKGKKYPHLTASYAYHPSYHVIKASVESWQNGDEQAWCIIKVALPDVISNQDCQERIENSKAKGFNLNKTICTWSKRKVRNKPCFYNDLDDISNPCRILVTEIVEARSWRSTEYILFWLIKFQCDKLWAFLRSAWFPGVTRSAEPHSLAESPQTSENSIPGSSQVPPPPPPPPTPYPPPPLLSWMWL